MLGEVLSVAYGVLVGVSPSRGWALAPYLKLNKGARWFLYSILIVPSTNVAALLVTTTPLLLAWEYLAYSQQWEAANPVTAAGLPTPIPLMYLYALCLGCITHSVLGFKRPGLHYSWGVSSEPRELIKSGLVSSLTWFDGLFIAMIAVEEPVAVVYYLLGYLPSFLAASLYSCYAVNGLKLVRTLWFNQDLALGLVHITVASYMLLHHAGVAPWF